MLMIPPTLLPAALLASSLAAPRTATIPDVDVEVAVHQKEDGKIGKSIHVLQLKCKSGSCWLMSFSLNQCAAVWLTTPTFPLVFEASSTADGGLTVTRNGDTLKVEEVTYDIGGVANNTYLFGFDKLDGLPTLTSFSGGFVKHSTILNKVISVEYVPVRGAITAVSLDCPLRARGIWVDPQEEFEATLSASDRALWERIKKDPKRPYYSTMRPMPSEQEQQRVWVLEWIETLDAWLLRNGMSADGRAKFRAQEQRVNSGVLSEPKQ